MNSFNLSKWLVFFNLVMVDGLLRWNFIFVSERERLWSIVYWLRFKEKLNFDVIIFGFKILLIYLNDLIDVF